MGVMDFSISIIFPGYFLPFVHFMASLYLIFKRERSLWGMSAIGKMLLSDIEQQIQVDLFIVYESASLQWCKVLNADRRWKMRNS